MPQNHKELFDQYERDLREAKKAAEKWWEDLIASETTTDRNQALHSVKRRWPDGPASHPYIIGVIQNYLRACEELNLQLGEDDEVPIHTFSIDWLDSVRTKDLLKFLDLSYWPIGLNQDGEVV